MNELVSLQAIVYGRVQGVFFRAFTTRSARALGLTGYVRNLPDGNVEVQAEGKRDRLEKLIDCLKTGPRGAIVEKVVTRWSEYSADFSSFDTRY